MADAARLEAQCRAHGLRLTAPRRAVLAALAQAGGAHDAVALYQAARRRHAATCLGTVYRFLRELERLGLAEAQARPHGRMHWQARPAGAAGDALAIALLQHLAARLGYRVAPLAP